MAKDRVRVAAIQIYMHGVPSEERWRKHIHWMNEAVRLGADLICTTEFFLGGETYWRKERIEFFRNFCKENGVYVAAHSYQRVKLDGDKRVTKSRIIFFAPGGEIIGTFDKVHLYPTDVHLARATQGTDFPVFDTKIGKIGFGVCEDLMIPEHIRCLRSRGAEIVIIPSRMPGNYLVCWKDVAVVRAIESCVYIVTIGEAGMHAVGTLAVSPRLDNPIVAEMGPHEGVMIADLDLAWLRSERNRKPVLDQLRKKEDVEELSVKTKVHDFVFRLEDWQPELYIPVYAAASIDKRVRMFSEKGIWVEREVVEKLLDTYSRLMTVVAQIEEIADENLKVRLPSIAVIKSDFEFLKRLLEVLKGE